MTRIEAFLCPTGHVTMAEASEPFMVCKEPTIGLFGPSPCNAQARNPNLVPDSLSDGAGMQMPGRIPKEGML